MRNATLVEIDTRRLNALIRKIPGNVATAVGATAFAIQRQAQINAPVDTGALRNSIYTRIGNRPDGYSAMAAEVTSLKPDAVLGQLPEPENATTAYVGPSVEYGVYVELGTSKRGAKPYLGPAVEAVAASLAEKFGDVANY